MHKIAFLRHPMGASGATYALYQKVLMQKDFVAEFCRENVSVLLLVKQRICVYKPPLGA